MGKGTGARAEKAKALALEIFYLLYKLVPKGDKRK